MATETKRDEGFTDKDNSADNIDESHKETLVAIRNYKKHGYNMHRILPVGEEYEVYDRKLKKDVKKIADGKSAEGTGIWSSAKAIKQTNDNFDLEDVFNYDRKGKKPCNVALIQGDVSGNNEYGRCAIDSDGKGKELVDEALLALNHDELAEKIRNTPQTKTPHGYHWLLGYRIKDFQQQLEGKLIYKGTGHEEVKLIANGGYVIEYPSTGKDGSYIVVKNDFDKIAELTKEELEHFIQCIKLVGREQEPEQQPSWADESEQPHANTIDNELLISIGKKLYKDGARHDFARDFASFMRRYLNMNNVDIHKVIESLDPNDQKNWETVEDVFTKPVNKIVNRRTFRDLIRKITGDERTATNVINELMSFAPPEKKNYVDHEFDLDMKPAARLLDLAMDNTDLCFKDQNRNYHAVIHDKTTDCLEIINLDSDEFDQRLSGLYRKDTSGNELARKDWKNQVIENLKDIVDEKAKVDEKRFKKTLYDRCVLLGDIYYYNLNDGKGEIVKVTKDSTEIIKQTSELLLFKKLPDDHEQVAPDFNLEMGKDGKVRDYLQDFLNTFNYEENESDKHTLILKSYILTLFLNAAAFPIHVATGDEGSNKTTLQRQIKSILDPSENKNGQNIDDKILGLTTALDLDPNHTWERFVTIHEHHLTCFDNLDHIPKNIFDEFCIAVTGYNVGKREHYKMKNMMQLIGRRPLAITSVLFTAPKPDYLDRVIHSKLIAAKEYKTEEQVWQEFYELEPKILGFIFNKIKEFLSEHDKLKGAIKPRTRLADFEVQCEIMSRCLGNDPNVFQDVWEEKKGYQIKDSLEKHSLYILLKNYLIKHRNEVHKNLAGKMYDTKPEYIIKDRQSSDHYSEILKDAAYSQTFLSDEDKQGWWKSVNLFGRELNTLRGQLKNVGIVITDMRDRKNNKNSKVIDYSKWAEDKTDEFWKVDDFKSS